MWSENDVAAFGSSGAISGPMIAMIEKKTRIVRPTMPWFERSMSLNDRVAPEDRRPKTPLLPDRIAVVCGVGWWPVFATSGHPHPRVEVGEQQVRDQVHHDDGERGEQEDPLQHR